MAPARHEMGIPQLDGADEKTPYGTRGSSKRKAAELSSAPPIIPSSTSGPKPSNRASKAKTAAKKTDEPRQPPTKKRRSSPTPAPEGPSSQSSVSQPTSDELRKDHAANGNGHLSSPSPEVGDQGPGSSATPGPDADSLSQPIPELLISSPSTSSVPNSPLADEGKNVPEFVNGQSRGRGKGRGRGGRGRGSSRGRGGTRGGRVGKAVANGRGAPANRGGRRRQKQNPVIDVVYKRKAEIKSHFKLIASLQRDALLELSDKSLELLTKDPSYHKSLPEYEEVCKGLDDELLKRSAITEAELRHKTALAKTTKEYNEYIVEQQYRTTCEELKEVYETRIMNEASWVAHNRSKNRRDVDDIPFSNGEDGSVWKQSIPPPKRVHPTGNPFVNPEKAATNASSTLGDNDYEQHPANWWAAKSKKEKAAILRKQEECVAEKEQRHRGGGRGRKGARQALFQPNAQHETAEGGDAVVEPEEGAEEQPEEEEAATADSPPPTVKNSPEIPDEDAEVNVVEDADSDAPAQDTDEYGASIPRKKGRRDVPAPYNRIATDTHIKFEDHEIGLRSLYFQKMPDGSTKRLGRDNFPNPKSGKIFYEQRSGRYNSARNQPEDLDQDIVAAHSLHPKFGIPIASSVNPEYEKCPKPYFKGPTNWDEPWENSSPVNFIHTALDGTRSISRTSRSEWSHRAKVQFDRIPLTTKLNEMLDQAGYERSRETTPAEPESPQIINTDLVDAVQEAADKEAREEAEVAERERLSKVTLTPHPPMYSPGPPQTPYMTSPQIYSPPSAYQPQNMGFSPPQATAQGTMGPPAPPSQRSHGYDPVRDRTYVTPYSQIVRPAPPPPAHATFANGGNLSELANAADFHGSRPPPGAYNAPINPYGAPPMLPQQQQRLSGLHPSHPSHPRMGMFSQYQASPYGPPPQPSARSNAASSRRAARELRPAPPTTGGPAASPTSAGPNRAPPPPPAPTAQYRGWGGNSNGYTQ